jgi:hypothetical protein
MVMMVIRIIDKKMRLLWLAIHQVKSEQKSDIVT